VDEKAHMGRSRGRRVRDAIAFGWIGRGGNGGGLMIPLTAASGNFLGRG
jgi:hypothetical protein